MADRTVELIWFIEKARQLENEKVALIKAHKYEKQQYEYDITELKQLVSGLCQKMVDMENQVNDFDVKHFQLQEDYAKLQKKCDELAVANSKKFKNEERMKKIILKLTKEAEDAKRNEKKAVAQCNRQLSTNEQQFREKMQDEQLHSIKIEELYHIAKEECRAAKQELQDLLNGPFDELIKRVETIENDSNAKLQHANNLIVAAKSRTDTAEFRNKKAIEQTTQLHEELGVKQLEINKLKAQVERKQREKEELYKRLRMLDITNASTIRQLNTLQNDLTIEKDKRKKVEQTWRMNYLSRNDKENTATN